MNINDNEVLIIATIMMITSTLIIYKLAKRRSKYLPIFSAIASSITVYVWNTLYSISIGINGQGIIIPATIFIFIAAYFNARGILTSLKEKDANDNSGSRKELR